MTFFVENFSSDMKNEKLEEKKMLCHRKKRFIRKFEMGLGNKNLEL